MCSESANSAKAAALSQRSAVAPVPIYRIKPYLCNVNRSRSTSRSGSTPKNNHFYRIALCACLRRTVDIRKRVRELFCSQTDRQTDRQTDKRYDSIIPPWQSSKTKQTQGLIADYSHFTHSRRWRHVLNDVSDKLDNFSSAVADKPRDASCHWIFLDVAKVIQSHSKWHLWVRRV